MATECKNLSSPCTNQCTPNNQNLKKLFKKIENCRRRNQRATALDNGSNANSEQKNTPRFGIKKYGATDIDWSNFNGVPPQRVGQPANRYISLGLLEKLLTDSHGKVSSSDDKVARLWSAIQHQRNLNHINPPSGVSIFSLHEKTRIVTVAYVYDKTSSQLFFGASFFRWDNESFSLDGPEQFSASKHRYTALMRLYRRPQQMTYQMPEKQVNDTSYVDKDQLQQDLRSALHKPSAAKTPVEDVVPSCNVLFPKSMNELDKGYSNLIKEYFKLASGNSACADVLKEYERIVGNQRCNVDTDE